MARIRSLLALSAPVLAPLASAAAEGRWEEARMVRIPAGAYRPLYGRPSDPMTRVAGELLRPRIDAGWLRRTVVLAGLAKIVGLALFFHTMWSRIRPVGSAAREAKGERF